jgi:hypothetical protein
MLAEPENNRKRLLSGSPVVIGWTGKVAELSTADSRSTFIVSLEIEQI